jgi:CheY-like chemotaxis protein
MNLAMNARDAMPNGGKLTIETANVDLDNFYARQHATLVPGSFVMLVITDTGIGMDAETQSHIFEPFFTTKAPGKGTGLGLATVYGIVKQSGGHVWVYSEPGQGTTFKIYLPQVQGEVEKEQPSIGSVKLVKGLETILLVEDEEPLREMICELLVESGYAVLAASDGFEALEIARQHKGPIHILLTDVVMPRMGGPALVKPLLVLQPEIKVLYMSGYTGYADVDRALVSSESELISKPFTRDTLLRKIQDMLRV